MNFQGKKIKCKAAVAWAANQPLSIEIIEVDPPKANEVRIKVVACGVCHTDAHSMDGHIGEVFPIIFGHEGAGIVESIGENVTELAVGDHVIASYMPQCKKCFNCNFIEENNFCEKLRFTNSTTPGLMEDGTSRFSKDGKPIYHFMGSSFSEYTVIPEYSCCKINGEAPLEKVCLLGCGIGTGYGAVNKVGKLRQNSTIGVWGLGGVGLAVIMAARQAGASKIIAIDTNPSKFKLAEQFGATECLNPNDYKSSNKSFQQILLENYNGGFDYTFECIGNVNTMKIAIESTHIGWGVCCIIGLAAENQFIQLDPLFLLMGITIKGSCFGGLRCKDDIPNLVEKYMNKEIKIDEFITNTFKLEDINQAFDILKKGEGLRSVIHF